MVECFYVCPLIINSSGKFELAVRKHRCANLLDRVKNPLRNAYHMSTGSLIITRSVPVFVQATEGAQTVFEQNLQIEKISSCYEDAKKALAEKVDEQQEVELAIKRKEVSF